MEHYKTSKLVNDLTVSKFVTKKWNEVNDLSNSQYPVNKNMRLKANFMLITLSIDHVAAAANENDKAQKNVGFKNNAPFRPRISQIDSVLIDNAEDLGIVMPMYNLLEYSQKCSMTSGSLWNYYRDEMYDVEDNVLDSKSFKHETKKVGKT